MSPSVIDNEGRTQDNARRIVTPLSLLRRYGLGYRKRPTPSIREATPVAWVAGLFMAVRRNSMRELGGFDEGFFLYCEDTALCMRMWNSGGQVYLVPEPGVSHVARRMTLRNWRHFAWHLQSLARMWSSAEFWRFVTRRHPIRDSALT